MPCMWFSRSKRIYLDYASATPVLPGALTAMRTAEALVGNPGAIHSEGVAAKKALEKARERVALTLGCKAREVIFTSGLTESNNLGILGVARRLHMAEMIEGSHWVVSAIEHDAVLQSFAEIERMGGKVSHIEPDSRGIISADAILRAVRPNTMLVSVGWANNEIGVVQPLREISRALREKNPSTLLHSDAGQAPLHFSPQVHTLGLDVLALGSNKLYGPHGIGALYLSNRAALAAIVLGGKQERGLRAGTENVALAAGFAEALAAVVAESAREAPRLRALRDTLVAGISERIPGAVINGDLKHTLPHMLNVSIPGVSSEYVTLALDHAGIAISTKSACREGEDSRSHVVEALGGPSWRSENTFRFSLGRETSEAHIIRALSVLVHTVAQTRS